MSEQVYVVRLNDEDLTEIRFVARSQWAHASEPNQKHWERRVKALESARPEHPERQAALEELAKFMSRYFGYIVTESPGWHLVDAETCEHLQGMVEHFRSLEGK